MKHILWLATLALILALALPGCSTTPAGKAVYERDGTATVTVAASRVANCRANGGCGLYSRNELIELVRLSIRQACPTDSGGRL